MKIPNNVWSTKTPKANRIFAKLSERFSHNNDCYDILWFRPFYDLMHPEGYYDYCGENVPDSAIEKWVEF